MNHNVDPELIRRYLAGELDNKAMHALEKQAMDDPFLADALEGFAERKPDQRVHLADLNRRLERRVQGREEKKGGIFALNYRWLAAAGVLLLVCTGLLWLLQVRTMRDSSIASQRANISDSSITDTLQYYNREEPVAWGKATPEKPLAISIPADTGLLAAKDVRTGAFAVESPLGSVMMKREDSIRPLAAAPSLADSLERRDAEVATAPTYKVTADEMASRSPVAAAPAPVALGMTTRLIQGRVKTSNAEGMPGVAVSVEGTGRGVLTDNQGNFSIRVADTTKDIKLVVAAVGFNQKKLDLNQTDNNLNITLNEQAKALSEVVTTGYNKKVGYRSQKEEVYQRPTPVNGYEQYKEYLAKNVHYPASAAAANITGRVRVSVRVMPDGTLEDIKITRRLQPDCDAEALRVVKEGPEWKPASDGKATRVQIDVHFAPQ
ncbi:energy transducer TonB [Chitinophaga sp. CF418]|uniref:energy transducer TonB n=1 Tax=Chitinophaga sp. CF418 TaxID=1855287 RepID=UPI00090F6B3D|nr:energy transducer TonB [Chitinophaga sp. CF418]SHM39328.1 TonB family C-terminal domain-containing protein [Chitinophaga sp. CF418]